MPKLDNFRTFKYSGNLWLHTSGQGATTTSGFYFARNISFDVLQGTYGKLTIVIRDTDEDVIIGSRLHDVLDGGGKEIYPDGVWVLDTILPIINVFGRREGFRATAKLTFISSS